MSKLATLQELLTNDLCVFRERFFPGMKPLAEAGAGREPRWRAASLELFESWRISGIVGGRNPSSYSESPKLWNPYFRRLKIRGVFFTFDLPAERPFLSFLDRWLRIPGALDLTVTDPFKREAFRVLRSLPLPVTACEQVEQTQTVNHLILDEEGGRVLALNTDGLGMIRALRGCVELEGRRILLLGAGGSAASIAAELMRFPCRLWIANRTVSRARSLAELLLSSGRSGGATRAEVAWSGFDEIDELLPHIDVLINTVSAGCPIGTPQAARLPSRAVLAESKYGAKADLAALASGRSYVDGRSMLFGQFVEAADTVRRQLGISADAHLRAVRRTIR